MPARHPHLQPHHHGGARSFRGPRRAGTVAICRYHRVPLHIRPADHWPCPRGRHMQTAWHKTGKDHWYRTTRFFGTMFLINFAMGVVTGIVQEFQFGMNWSDYSRFVSDVFGARFTRTPDARSSSTFGRCLPTRQPWLPSRTPCSAPGSPPVPLSPPSRSSSPCASGLVALIIGPEVFAPLRAVGKNFHAAAEGIDAADACLTLHEEEMGPYLACSVNSVAVSGLSVKSREGCTPENVTFVARPGAITALVGPNKRRQVDGIPRRPRIASRCLRLRHGHRTPPRPYLLPVRPLLTAGTVADNLRLGGTQQPVKPTSSPPTPPSAPPSPPSSTTASNSPPSTACAPPPPTSPPSPQNAPPPSPYSASACSPTCRSTNSRGST